MTNKPLPPGAHGAAVPGTRANAKLKGAPFRKPVTIDHSLLADARGGPELVISNGVHVAGDRKPHSR